MGKLSAKKEVYDADIILFNNFAIHSVEWPFVREMFHDFHP